MCASWTYYSFYQFMMVHSISMYELVASKLDKLMKLLTCSLVYFTTSSMSYAALCTCFSNVATSSNQTLFSSCMTY